MDLGSTFVILECQFHQFHPCAHASTLSSVGLPNSKTSKKPANRRAEDATFDVLSFAKAISRGNQKLSILLGGNENAKKTLRRKDKRKDKNSFISMFVIILFL